MSMTCYCRWPHHAGQRDEGSVRLRSSGASLLLVTLLCGCKLFLTKTHSQPAARYTLTPPDFLKGSAN